MAASEAFEAVFTAGANQLVITPPADVAINPTIVNLSTDADCKVQLAYGASWTSAKSLPAGYLPANGGAFMNLMGAEKPGGIGEELRITVIGAANVTLNLQYNLNK